MVAPFNIDAFSTKTLRHFWQALEWSKKKFHFQKDSEFSQRFRICPQKWQKNNFVILAILNHPTV